MSDRVQDVERQLLQRLKSTCQSYELLAPGDRIMVAVSGGKDSYTLLHLLGKLARSLPFDLQLIAVHLDQRQPGYDGAPLVRWLEHSGFEFEVLSEDTYSVVMDHVRGGSTYCSLCSRLRRGILYTAAERLGCNKIALGHHRDDTLETFLMNLIYAGRLQAMPASYRTDDGRFQVIRPLIECAEPLIARFAQLMEFPILPCNLCGSQSGLKRDAMTALLDTLERDHPNVRSVMLNALRNVSPTHLLDRDLHVAWEERPAHVRPTSSEPAAPRPAQAAALPVRSSVRRLPLLTSHDEAEPRVLSDTPS